MIQVVDGTSGDAALVAAALAGDGTAFASLFEGWFDRCFDVALRIVRSREAAAEVAQEVFLAAWRDLAVLRDHEAFGGWVLRAARNRALNRLQKERRSVTIGDEATAAALDATAATPDAATDALAGTGADLVWAASAALGARDASILDLHLRHGLAAPELAEALGVTANNAHQLLFRLKARLGDAVRASVLWHGGRPACPELQDGLHRAGLGAFGPEAARVAQRHAAACERCGERQRQALAPEVLFAGVPLVLAGPRLKAQVISALRDEGVPLGEVPPPPPAATSGSGGPAAAVAEPEPQRRRRRTAFLALALAVLLLVAGALLAQQPDPPVPVTELPVVASVETLASTSSSPDAPLTTTPSAGTGPSGPRPTEGTVRATTSATAAATTSTMAASTTSTTRPTRPTTTTTLSLSQPPVQG